MTDRSPAQIVDLLKSRLLFVTGKGGVGKTAFSIATGLYSAEQGRKTIIVEVDNFHPSANEIFNVAVDYSPKEVRPNLYCCNITWKNALSDWLYSTVKVKSVVRLIEKNKVAMLFLDATPGAREIVILSKIIDLLNHFEQVIVDLPASGHALGILRVPETAQSLMKAGPVFDKATHILSVFKSQFTALAVVALPEHMVVNESLEFTEKIQQQVPSINKVGMVLNRMTIPSLTEHELSLLKHLNQGAVDGTVRQLVEAGLWEAELEAGTQSAIDRLESEFESVFSFPRFGALGGFDGGAERVVEQMFAHIKRQLNGMVA